MTLEELQDRKQQLDVAINNATQSVYLLQGHKAEVEFQISELVRLNAETKVDEPAVTEEAPAVQC